MEEDLGVAVPTPGSSLQERQHSKSMAKSGSHSSTHVPLHPSSSRQSQSPGANLKSRIGSQRKPETVSDILILGYSIRQKHQLEIKDSAFLSKQEQDRKSSIDQGRGEIENPIIVSDKSDYHHPLASSSIFDTLKSGDRAQPAQYPDHWQPRRLENDRDSTGEGMSGSRNMLSGEGSRTDDRDVDHGCDAERSGDSGDGRSGNDCDSNHLRTEKHGRSGRIDRNLFKNERGSNTRGDVELLAYGEGEAKAALQRRREGRSGMQSRTGQQSIQSSVARETGHHSNPRKRFSQGGHFSSSPFTPGRDTLAKPNQGTPAIPSGMNDVRSLNKGHQVSDRHSNEKVSKHFASPGTSTRTKTEHVMHHHDVHSNVEKQKRHGQKANTQIIDKSTDDDDEQKAAAHPPPTHARWIDSRDPSTSASRHLPLDGGLPTGGSRDVQSDRYTLTGMHQSSSLSNDKQAQKPDNTPTKEQGTSRRKDGLNMAKTPNNVQGIDHSRQSTEIGVQSTAETPMQNGRMDGLRSPTDARSVSSPAKPFGSMQLTGERAASKELINIDADDDEETPEPLEHIPTASSSACLLKDGLLYGSKEGRLLPTSSRAHPSAKSKSAPITPYNPMENKLQAGDEDPIDEFPVSGRKTDRMSSERQNGPPLTKENGPLSLSTPTPFSKSSKTTTGVEGLIIKNPARLRAQPGKENDQEILSKDDILVDPTLLMINGTTPECGIGQFALRLRPKASEIVVVRTEQTPGQVGQICLSKNTALLKAWGKNAKENPVLGCVMTFSPNQLSQVFGISSSDRHCLVQVGINAGVGKTTVFKRIAKHIAGTEEGGGMGFIALSTMADVMKKTWVQKHSNDSRSFPVQKKSDALSSSSDVEEYSGVPPQLRVPMKRNQMVQAGRYDDDNPRRPLPRKRTRLDGRDDDAFKADTKSHDSDDVRPSEYSLRPRKPSVPREPSPDNWDELLFVWPPTGRAEFNITAGDRSRLREGEFLNDSLEDFGLKKIISELDDRAKLRHAKEGGSRCDISSRTHVFSSFFFKKLSIKSQTKISVGNPCELQEAGKVWEPFEGVSKWTRNVDVFEKDFLIIPINASQHWFLAVVYKPGLILPSRRTHQQSTGNYKGKTPAASGNRSSESDRQLRDRAETPASPKASFAAMNPTRELSRSTRPGDQTAPGKASAAKRLSTFSFQPYDPGAQSTQNSHSAESGSTNEGRRSTRSTTSVQTLEAIDIDSHPSKSEDTTTSLGKPGKDYPLIMIFDSLGGTHKGIINTIHRWLSFESFHKKHEVVAYGRWAPAGIGYHVPVPGQQDWSSCGIYLLHYVEQLLGDPDSMMDYIISRIGDKPRSGRAFDDDKRWGADKVKDQRNRWKATIDSLTDEYRKRLIQEAQQKAETQVDKDVKPSQASTSTDIVLGSGTLPSGSPSPAAHTETPTEAPEAVPAVVDDDLGRPSDPAQLVITENSNDDASMDLGSEPMEVDKRQPNTEIGSSQRSPTSISNKESDSSSANEDSNESRPSGSRPSRNSSHADVEMETVSVEMDELVSETDSDEESIPMCVQVHVPVCEGSDDELALTPQKQTRLVSQAPQQQASRNNFQIQASINDSYSNFVVADVISQKSTDEDILGAEEMDVDKTVQSSADQEHGLRLGVEDLPVNKANYNNSKPADQVHDKHGKMELSDNPLNVRNTSPSKPMQGYLDKSLTSRSKEGTPDTGTPTEVICIDDD